MEVMKLSLVGKKSTNVRSNEGNAVEAGSCDAAEVGAAGVGAQSSTQGGANLAGRAEARAQAAAQLQRRLQLIDTVLRKGFALLQPFSTSLTARAAEKLFFHPFRYPEPAREREILASGHRVDLRVNTGKESVELACWSWGDGPTVFLLHGWSGRAGQLGAFVAPLVEAGFSVVAFDTPAHGKSTGKDSSAIIFAKTLRQVIDRFGPAHAVIAHSMGGWASAYALLEGTGIANAVLIGAPVDPTAYSDRFAERFDLSMTVIEKMMLRLERRIGIPRAAFKLTDRIEDGGADLERVKGSRALIVHDRGDEEVSFANAEVWGKAWPGARVHATDGLGHYKVLRAPGVVAEVVRFLK